MSNIINKNSHNICFIGIKKILENGETAFNIRGTGLILEGKKVVTCAHIYNEIPVDSRNSIFFGISKKNNIGLIINYQFYDGNLINKNDIRDIAIFSIKDDQNELNEYGINQSLLMVEADINKLTPTTIINFAGYPLPNDFLNMGMGITLLTSQSIIGAVKFKSSDKKIDFILIDKHINPGSSGSPVFFENKIIGLASGTINQTNKIGESLVNIPVGVGIIRTSNYILDLL